VGLVSSLASPSVAKELAMTGEPVAADRAHELGLLNRVVAAEDLESAVVDLAPTLATKPPLAIQAIKRSAAVAANGTGLELAGVRTVGTGDVSVQPDRREDFALARAGDGGAGGGAPTSFESGKVTVSAQVTVVYNATTTGG
jgi:enoyl-CoA hydratase/carnithine racemase